MATQTARTSSDMAELDKLINVDGLNIIDAGCGNMRFAKALAARGAQVLAIDPDPIQAKLNRQATLEPGVRFVEAGADALPAETSSIDGIMFSYSLHHVPAELFPKIFEEAARVLKPGGFLIAMEPVAEGELNEVTSLFHDEKQVRAGAQLALDTYGTEDFEKVEVVEYCKVVEYQDWDTFADHYCQKSFNTNYTDEDVRDSRVQTQFEKHAKRLDYRFLSPMKITRLRKPMTA